MEVGVRLPLFQGPKKHYGLDILSPRKQRDKGVCQNSLRKENPSNLCKKDPLQSGPGLLRFPYGLYAYFFLLENRHHNSLFLGRP